jgi:hypothetical protein
MRPTIRYEHDSDELQRLGEWLMSRLRDINLSRDIALDYLLLADNLERLAEQAREFARTHVDPIP